MAAKRKTGEQVEQMVAAAVARVRELAVNGVAPTLRQYDMQRGTAPTAAALLRRGVKWAEVVRRAGLRPALGGAAAMQQRADRVPAAVEAEIAAAFAAQEETAAWLRAWPMRAIPTRLEVCESPLPDGSGVFRVTRAYASLR